MGSADLYTGREQTLVKHFMLRQYLRDFAHKIGHGWDTIVYVDCFSGPWQARSEDFADTSFSVAIGELRDARETLARSGRRLNLRCFFVEENRSAYERLQQFASKVDDIEIETYNGTLEESVESIVRFVRRSRSRPFPFIFVDPTGWTGFALDVISPLLRLSPGEVLINFMTGHIRRFIDSPDEPTKESFERLFGTPDFRSALKGLVGQDREDAAVQGYMEAVKAAGRFDYSSMAVVLHPEINRSHFHLIHLTRSPKGVEVFKAAEYKSMLEMEKVRARAQQRRRESRAGARELFPAEEVHNQAHFDDLRERYLGRARESLIAELQSTARLRYDHAWARCVAHPLVWHTDLKKWIADWRDQGLLLIEGMEPRQREPKLNRGNALVWRGGEDSVPIAVASTGNQLRMAQRRSNRARATEGRAQME